jgi:hypothetical protein
MKIQFQIYSKNYNMQSFGNLKICQKGKLFIVFPAISMKNLGNLDIRNVTISSIKCGCLKILINKKCRAPLVSLRRRLNGAQTLASHACDSCSATATTLRRCCRPAATFAPRATHAAAAPCVISLRCQSEREAVLSSSRNSSRMPTHSALPLTIRLCSITSLLCSMRRSADHHAPLSCASEPRQAGH